MMEVPLCHHHGMIVHVHVLHCLDLVYHVALQPHLTAGQTQVAPTLCSRALAAPPVEQYEQHALT